MFSIFHIFLFLSPFILSSGFFFPHLVLLSFSLKKIFRIYHSSKLFKYINFLFFQKCLSTSFVNVSIEHRIHVDFCCFFRFLKTFYYFLASIISDEVSAIILFIISLYVISFNLLDGLSFILFEQFDYNMPKIGFSLYLFLIKIH